MTGTSIHLIVRRKIKATPERLFEAWTSEAQLKQWWGPKGVRCSAAEVDLRVGGRYRLANEMESGETVWITGEFERIERPRELIYTWSIEPATQSAERVTVRFEPHGDRTEVIVVHESIASEEARAQHQHGWLGCLDGLAALCDPE